MTILDDIAKIPRKHKNGFGNIKTITSVYINPVTLDVAKAIAKQYNVSISGFMELALDRLLVEVMFERVPPATLEAVKRESARRGMVPSALVREALDLLLKEAGERLAA